MLIKKAINYFLSFFRIIYIFESKKNKKNISYKNFILKKYVSLEQIKDFNIIKKLKKDKKIKRLKNNQTLCVLYLKKKPVCTGWMNHKSEMLITEINKKIKKKNTIILFDFFTPKLLRNKGYYSKILNLIKNFNTKKTFLIYCLKSNKSSEKGILNSKFIFMNKLKKI